MMLKTILGGTIAVFLIVMMPSIHAVEYNTARETQEQWIEEKINTLDVRELLANFQNGETKGSFEQLMNENGLANCILTPLKWLAHILLKVLMVPFKLAVKIMVKLLFVPIKLLSMAFRLMVLPIKLMLLPLRLAMIPLVVLIKMIALPFKMLDLLLFLLCPFKHSPY